ncbi:MAG: hypothetical protein IJ187_07760 [Neisseriaceae bacterium]|nr:hypothetical protein [Neisseriaceae bacterium]
MFMILGYIEISAKRHDSIVDKLQNDNAFFRLAVLFILSQALRLFYF